MRTWWIFWSTVVLAAVLWIAVPLVAGREAFRSLLSQPLSLAILVAPVAAAGINLIIFLRTHEEVCNLEAQRHGWLRAVVGRGYSARLFAATGVVLLAVTLFILAAAVVQRP